MARAVPAIDKAWGEAKDQRSVVKAGGRRASAQALVQRPILSQSTGTLHLGLGQIDRIDSVEVRWLGGERGDLLRPRGSTRGGSSVQGSTRTPPDLQFAVCHRTRRARSARADRRGAGLAEGADSRVLAHPARGDGRVEARRRLSNEPPSFFTRALELNPEHGDSRYYLANLLWSRGRSRTARSRELDSLRQRNPLSHRAASNNGASCAQ